MSKAKGEHADSLIRSGACDRVAAGTLVTAVGSPCLPPHDNSALVVLVVLELVHAAVLVEDDQLDRHLLRVVPSNLVRLCRQRQRRNRNSVRTTLATRHRAKRYAPDASRWVHERQRGTGSRARSPPTGSPPLGETSKRRVRRAPRGEHQNHGGGGRVHEEGEGTAAEMSSASGFWSSKWMRG